MSLFAQRERRAARQDARRHVSSTREPNDKSNVQSDSQPRAIVFIVDDDVSLRESLAHHRGPRRRMGTCP
jgi:hypothetical protein